MSETSTPAATPAGAPHRSTGGGAPTGRPGRVWFARGLLVHGGDVTRA